MMVNEHFDNDAYRIQVLMPADQYQDDSGLMDTSLEQVYANRIHQLDACIVRTMKKMEQATFAHLLSQVLVELKFNVTVACMHVLSLQGVHPVGRTH